MILAEAVADGLRRERDGQVREFVAVRREAHVGRELRHAGARERAECGVGDRARHLPRAVGAEIHEHDHVAVGHRRGPAVAIRNHRRLHEFVVLAAGVGRVEPGLRGRGGEGRAAIDQQLVGGGDAIPALVAVHRVVAADDGGDARAGGFRAHAVHERQRCGGAARRRVAAVEECVDEDSRHARGRRHADQRGDLPLVAVHAAGGEQAQHVHCRTVAPRRGQRGGKHGIALELAGLDRVVDAREVLVDHAARPDIQVTHFGVAHLAGGQPHMQLGGIDRRVRRRREQPGPVRHRGDADRVVRRGLAAAESVQDQQDRPGARAEMVALAARRARLRQ